MASSRISRVRSPRGARRAGWVVPGGMGAAPAWVAGAAAIAGGVGAERADAAIVHSGIVNINIPSTTAGVYLNVVTGAFNSVPAFASGWDVNPWSSAGLGFSNPSAPAGGVYVVLPPPASPNSIANLAPGTMIDGSSTFGSGAPTNSGALTLNSDQNLVGFRFQNELNGNQIHYGWMRISLSGATNAQPRAIVEYAWEDQAGVGILAGNTGQSGGTGVPEPGAATLGLLAAGCAGVALLRRRRRLAAG